MSRKKLTESVIFPGFSYRFRKVRGNLTQEEFGKILGVRNATISRYESGRIPDAETLKKVADYGKVSVEWLLYGEEAEMDTPQLREHAPEIYDARPVAPLDLPILIEVVAAVEKYLTTHKLKRRPIQKARLFALVYEHCTDNKEHPDEILIKRYLPLAD